MQEFRCQSCHKLLGKCEDCKYLEIKCPRCGFINVLPQRLSAEHSPPGKKNKCLESREPHQY